MGIGNPRWLPAQDKLKCSPMGKYSKIIHLRNQTTEVFESKPGWEGPLMGLFKKYVFVLIGYLRWQPPQDKVLNMTHKGK